MAHGYCFLWRPDILWLHVVSDVVVVLSYYSIPFALFYFAKKRTDLAYSWIMVLFGLFIFLCGTTHLMDVVIIWSPQYWLAGIVKALTALVSITAAVLIWPLLPKLLALPSPAQLLTTNKQLQEIIEQQKLTEQQLNKFSLAVEYAPSIIVITDQNGEIEYCNPMFYQTTGYSKEETVGKKISMVKSGLTDKQVYANLWNTIKAGHVWQGEFLDRKKNGDLYWCWQSISPVKDEEGNINHFIAITQDISERKQNEKIVQRLAFYDPLTDLPNRILFKDRLEQAVIHARRNNSIFAVMYLDLDRFKNINDSLGHLVGDLLLVEVGKRLKDCLRKQDTVARLGGDEFSIIVTEISHIETAGELAQKIISAISQPLSIEENEIFITTSIGISTFPSDSDESDDIAELIKKADKALYQAKDAGRNNYEYFNEEINTQSLRRLAVENELRNALKQNEFKVHYQPKIDLVSKKIVSVEALLRWNNKKLGAVSPAEFIPIAEETSLIIKISEWVLKTACYDLKHWEEKIGMQVPVAINLSARQFREPDLLTKINTIREEADIPAQLLEFEITESMVMDNPEKVIKVLGDFKQLGFKLSIDDFGTGYSSLNYLKRFPVDYLKIDYSFVRDIVSDRSDACIVSAIIALAHSLNLKVIAEGVSSFEQLEFLKDRDCEYVQGFYFSPAIPSSQLMDFMQTKLPDC